MKPARSPMVTSILPSEATNASMSATTSGSVTTLRTTSTSFITGAGLKKCMPTTLPGREVATAISVTDSEEVLVARIVSGRQISSRAVKMARLRSSCSGTASMTRSTSAIALSSVSKADPAQQLGLLGLGQLAAGHRPAGGVLDVAPAAGHGRLVAVDRHHAQAVAGEHLGDARAHGAQAHHAHPGECPRHCWPPRKLSVARPWSVNGSTVLTADPIQ